MAKKKIQNHEEDDGDGEKKQKDVNVVVLKIDLHCEGCAGRVVKAVRTLDGVEKVRVGEGELNKITVFGNLNPVKLRQNVEEKTKKTVELISPVIKKMKDSNNAAESGGGENKKKQQKAAEKDQESDIDEAGKETELPVTTGVLKVLLHCEGCVRRIHKIVTKTKGYLEMSLDRNKDLVTVKGAIDMELLAEALQHKLKRTVEIVPAKKDGDGKKKGGGGGGGGKRGKGGNGGGNDGDGNDTNGGGGGEKKGKNKGGEDGNSGGGRPEMYRMENYGVPVGYSYPQYGYGMGYGYGSGTGSGYGNYVHAPQMFSDENPNACVII